MAQKSPKYVGDAQTRSLLETFSCPVPFHAVRAQFMGNIASPVLSVSPIHTIEEFWPDGLPVFENEEEANALMEGLLSLWNHLAQHQKRNKPFKLIVKPFGDDRDEMREFLTVRTQEIDYFLEGLLDGDAQFPIPDDIREEIALLAENYALMNATLDLLDNVASTDQEISSLTSNLRELSKIAGIQINDIILACVRWRRKPTLH